MALGRPREFDSEKAIGQAMKLFWRNGYDGTSLSDLTAELGITRPSLYAAFGNKEALFMKVLDRYDQATSHFIQASLTAPTARSLAEGLIYGACAFHSNKANPPGCLMVHGALIGNETSAPVRHETKRRRAVLKDEITARLILAKASGDLPEHANPAALSSYLVAVLRGIAIEAASGARSEELRSVAGVAMTAWPT